MWMPRGSRCQNLRNKSSLQNESSFDADQDGNHNFPAAHDTTGHVESITLRPARETVSSIEPVSRSSESPSSALAAMECWCIIRFQGVT